MESEGIAVQSESPPLSLTDSERIKRARFEIDPTCSSCTTPIEKVEDAMLLDNVSGTDGKGHQLLIHNNCFGDTLGYMARMARIPRRRF